MLWIKGTLVWYGVSGLPYILHGIAPCISVGDYPAIEVHKPVHAQCRSPSPGKWGGLRQEGHPA